MPKAVSIRGVALGAPVACGLAVLAATLGLHGQGTGTIAAKAGAGELVVVSSHDAGPGTLRDAILAADRLSSPARIVIKAKLVVIESRLPPLINPHGIEIDAAPDAGTIDAALQTMGPTLEVDRAGTTIRGVHILRAPVCGIMVNAPGAQLDSLTVKDSKVAIMVNAGSTGTTVRTSLLEHDETGVLAEAGVRNVSLVSDIFRLNTRAGFWFVGTADPGGADPAHDEGAGNVRVRIIDGVFEKNAIGAVLANRLSVFEKDRFLGNRDGALTILGGAVRVEDSEIRGSGGAAISVTSGRSVVLARNTLVDNASAALVIRNSEILVESNTLRHNGLGIVLISSRAPFAPVIKDNLITQSTADAITLIGGPSLLQHNQVIKNGGAGLRQLDLMQGRARFKVEPRLDANVFRGNGVDIVGVGVYRLSGVL